MNLFFIQDNDDELKKYYKYTLDSQNVYVISTHLRGQFDKRLSELNILGKFNELSQKKSPKSFMMKLFLNIIIL